MLFRSLLPELQLLVQQAVRHLRMLPSHDKPVRPPVQSSKTAVIDGVTQLHGCEVRACDLRAGAAMVIAALCAEGTTTIEDAHYIERGYEDIIGKFSAIGGKIRRVETFEGNSQSAAG